MTSTTALALDRLRLATSPYRCDDLGRVEAACREFLSACDEERGHAITQDSLIPITLDLSELDEPCGPQNVDATGAPVEGV